MLSSGHGCRSAARHGSYLVWRARWGRATASLFSIYCGQRSGMGRSFARASGVRFSVCGLAAHACSDYPGGNDVRMYGSHERSCRPRTTAGRFGDPQDKAHRRAKGRRRRRARASPQRSRQRTHRLILSLKATIFHPARMLGATPVLSGVAGAGSLVAWCGSPDFARPQSPVAVGSHRLRPGQLEGDWPGEHPRRPTHIPNTIADNIDITLEADGAYPVGVSKTTMRLAWKHGVPPTVAPLKIELRHPIRPALERIFLGELRPGERRTVEVPLEVEGPLSAHSVTLGCEGSIVEAHLSGVPWRLVVLARAPTVPGRFEGQVHLQLAKPRLPATRLLVVGIVPPPASSDPINARRNPNITHP